MANRHGTKSKGRAHMSATHLIGLFVFYGVLAFCVFAFTFFYVFTGGEFWLVIALTLIFGAVATVVHARSGRRTRIDALIDKGP